MILSITVKEITFWNGNLIHVIRNVSSTFDLKIIGKRAQICDRCSLKNILPCSADFTCVDRSTILEV